MKKHLFLFIVCIMCTCMAVGNNRVLIGSTTNSIQTAQGESQKNKTKTISNSAKENSADAVKKEDDNSVKTKKEVKENAKDKGHNDTSNSEKNNKSLKKQDTTNGADNTVQSYSDENNSSTNEDDQNANNDEYKSMNQKSDSKFIFSKNNLVLVSGFILALTVFAVIFLTYGKANKALHNARDNKRSIGDLKFHQDNIDKHCNQLEKDMMELKQAVERLKESHPQSRQNETLGINMNGMRSGQSLDERAVVSPVIPSHVADPQIVFLGTPYSDGRFSRASKTKTMDSVYKLTTYDSRNGSFIFCNDPESIGTANLALTAQKAACKIKNSEIRPSFVTTNKPGQAVLENGEWIVSEKADITFER